MYLGEGSYSNVYKVKRLIDGNVYALKKVKLLNLSEKEKQNALNEVRILASVKSNYVICYKEAFIDDKESTLSIVMEYADNGDLFQKIVHHKKTSMLFDENEIWCIFIQLVKGLKALHDLNILHRDLKSANVFLESDGSAKLGDLNVSKVARKGLGYTQTGTPYYASPEVWKDQPYNYKSDIWSLGCVLYEMITLKPPFRAENMEGLYNKVIKGVFPKIPEQFSQDLNTIVNLLIQVNPNDRPSCEQILKNPIVEKRIEYFDSVIIHQENYTDDHNLLQTIYIPKNLVSLSDKLPKANYEQNDSTLTNNNSNNKHEKKLKKSYTISCGSINKEHHQNKHQHINILNDILHCKLHLLPHRRNRIDDTKRKNYSIDYNKPELPHLHLLNIERKNESKIDDILIQRSRQVNNHSIEQIQKIYASYMGKNNKHIKMKKLKVMYSPNANYLNKLERYYSVIRPRIEHKSNNDSMERKIYSTKRRKLSPIKRKNEHIHKS